MVGDVLSVDAANPGKLENDRVGEVARGWPTPTRPGDMERLIPLSPMLLPPLFRLLEELVAEPGESAPGTGIELGGDDEEIEDPGVPPGIGAGDA